MLGKVYRSLFSHRIKYYIIKVARKLSLFRSANRNLSAAVPESHCDETIGSSIADFRAQYGYDCRLLVPSTRPNSVEQLYAIADESPSPLIAACDQFRDDGLRSADLFSPCLTLLPSPAAGDADDIDTYGCCWRQVCKMFSIFQIGQLQLSTFVKMCDARRVNLTSHVVARRI